MSPFWECKMALDDGERLQVSEIVGKEIEASLTRKIPRLMKLEEFTRPIVAAGLLVIGLPLSYVGLQYLVEKHASATFKDIHQQSQKDPDGPLGKLKSFSTGLKETFEGQVDSATFKMLRFGCTQDFYQPANNFPVCGVPATGATQQAKAAVDEDEQTVAFAARPKHQSIKLVLALRPVDPQTVLNRVALVIEWVPLDIRSADNKTVKRIKIDKSKVSKIDYLVEVKGNAALGLYGLSEGMDNQALNIEIDLTDALKDINSPLHQIRIKAVSHPDATETLNGTERFFLRAQVSVNHRVTAQ